MNGYVARKGDWVPGTKLSRTARCQATRLSDGFGSPGARRARDQSAGLQAHHCQHTGPSGADINRCSVVDHALLTAWRALRMAGPARQSRRCIRRRPV